MIKFPGFIICCILFFSSEINGQELQLKITNKDSTKNAIIDGLNYSKRFKDFNSLKTEVDSFQTRLYQEGFINNKIATFKKENNSVFNVNIDLNNKFKYLHIYYDKNSINQHITKGLRNKGDSILIIPFKKTEPVLIYINERLTDNGYPFTKIKLSEIKIEDSETLSASLIVEKKEKQRALDKIILKGYEKFPKSFLKRYLKYTFLY